MQPRVSQMTLVVTSMLFNCGGAMYNSDAAVCEKISFYKLAVQQIPHQACRSHPVKRDTGNATIHRNGTKPRSFFWKRGSHCNALCLTRFCRATAENETSDKQTLVFSLCCLFVSLCGFSLWRLAAPMEIFSPMVGLDRQKILSEILAQRC